MNDDKTSADPEKEETEPLEATGVISSEEAQARRGDSAESDTSEVLEFEFNEDGEEDLKKTLKKFRADLKKCKAEKEEYLTGWQKERAEFANYRKGEDDRKAMLSESMRERILNRFLSVMDSFNMAFAHKESWDKVDENWRKGVEYIYGQMNTIFEEYGVKAIGVEGEIFDPNIHQSMELVATDKKELDHTIATVIQKGYKLGPRIMRAARVNVYEYKE
ncbi:nucleotide exchange factor GrpE [Candidatus Nomurabacteria bacterium RIFCSPHIGHO2_01_FULL_42_15]|uniref:Protein GrpE n=1 Tax=Candidatus Nomurabacteria bacterium RIFCSPHIGHO2_01_FULL_42_15 TaxID=1801742 RepID=A0A1F6VGB1_9BACT|nr:MAG: nucleotide exchange factor GrpE [Candidatus Nomurabacteria bacterium RIFCSPHIGHO2_01_FULL_42_15]OGI92969.1 MAG: nucleotide exchange factor GrpE [Candidatus Nomurabacteria bacterium RIFCSPLOWO2_01_FULL_41_18]